MSYQLLLVGKNSTLMDVFFSHMSETFVCLSCTVRSEDITNHLKMFTPDAVIYCLNKETPENLAQVVSCRTILEEKRVPLLVAGADAECADFAKASDNMAAQELTKPFTASLLTEKILQFFTEEEKQVETGKSVQADSLPDVKIQEAAEQKKHILIIDDDPLILKLIREHLHEEYEVGAALSGKVAMKFLEKRKVDLILLDYEMPEENGPAVLKKLHANEATKDIPVVFLTGITEKNKVREALSQKPHDYVLKPIDKNKLIKVIKQIIG